jgi:serine/threonine protein kinase
MQKPKFIGEGSFGCVIQPEVACKKDIEVLNKKPPKRLAISKLFLSRDNIDLRYFLKESKLAKLINKWDPESKFFVAPSKICKTSVKEILKNPVSKKCYDMPYYSMKERTDSILINQIVMPNFGIDLAKYLDKYITKNSKKFPLKRWILILKNVLLGLIVLQKHKYIHLDMKHQNLLYDEDKLRIIDFSIVTPTTGFYKLERNKERLKHNYFPYPFEFLLVYYFHYSTSCTVEKGCFIFKEYVNSLKSFNAFNNVLKFHSMKEILNTVTELVDWIHHTPDWLDVLMEHATNIDVYGLATICMSIDHDLDYSTVSNEEAIKYIQFIKCIGHLDFRMRPTPAQAYDIYKTLF